MSQDLSQLHNINRNAIDELIRRYTQASAQGNFSIADVLLANAEFLGRMIVNLADTPVQGVNMAQIMEEHLKRTLEAGYAAKGYNMGGN